MIIKSDNPVNAALETLDFVGWAKPGDLSIDEIAYSLEAHIKETTLEGSEGRIIMDNSKAIITIDSSIRIAGKRNFVLAHELGHLLLHRKESLFYSDTNKTLSDWYKNDKLEVEANQYATELLMPSKLFVERVTNKKLNLNLIKNTANYFQVSCTSCALRYIKLGDYPSMVVFVEDSIVQWKQASEDFPFQFLPLYNKVPVYTVAGDFFNGNGLEDNPVLVDVIEWFPEDFEAQKKSKWQIYEQCFQVSENGVISFLWTF